MTRSTRLSFSKTFGPVRGAGGALLTVAVAMVGCSSPHARQSDLATIATDLHVASARVDDEHVYIQYSGVVGQELDITLRKVLHAKARPVRDVDLIAPLEFVTATAWSAEAADAEAVPVLSPLVYDDLIDTVVEKAAPPGAGQAVSVRVDLDEYVVWRDDDGDAHLDLFDDVIVELDLVETKTPADLRELLLEDIDRHLPPGATRVVLRTADSGPGSMPFMYVDTATGTVNMLKVAGVRGAEPLEPVGMVADTGFHVVFRSFFLEIPRSPVRMTTRTVCTVGYTVGDAATHRRSWGAEGEPPPLYDGPPMDQEEFEEVLDKVTKTKRVAGRVTRCLIDGDEFFPVLRESILKAEESVDMRTYLFDNDDYAVSIADLMKDRSNEGIDVRILTDGLGTIIAASTDSPEMPADFKKPAKISWYFSQSSKVRYRSQSNPFLMGDHGKTTIIDHDFAFLGGMNIAREYRYEWHDMMIEVHGPVVDVLDQEFENIWQLAGFFGDWQFALYKMFGEQVTVRDAGTDDYPIRVLKTVPGNSQIYKAQIEAIRRAKRRIYIENLYFSNALFLQELIDARHRGVDVRVILPMQGNWGVLSEAAKVTANKLFGAGVRIFMYPRMTHVKAAVYDDWACVGSANFDKLSLRVNEEINLGYTDPGAVNELLERLFEADFETAVEMTEPFDLNILHHAAEVLSDQL